ncbi:MAG TPA: metallophosphoesterase [Thermoanaerobaculia bacterium]
MRNVLIATLFAFSALADMPPIAPLPTGAPVLAANQSATKYTFVVAGDNRPAHRGDPLTQPMLDIVSKLSSNPPAFVMWDGDLVFGKEAIKIVGEYTDVLNALRKVPVPVFNAPGNHELVVQTNIACGTKSDPWNAEMPDYSGAMASIYAASVAPAYGMFRYGNAAFLVVNTDDVPDVALPSACDYNGMVSQAQLTALQTSLAQLQADSTVAHIFVFMHRPVHSNSHAAITAKGDSAYAQRLKAFRDTLDTKANDKMTFVFASHDHLLYVYPEPKAANGPFHRSVPATKKPTFIVTGGAGAPLEGCNKTPPPSGAYYHYMTVSVDGADVTVTVDPLYGTKPCQAPTMVSATGG